MIILKFDHLLNKLNVLLKHLFKTKFGTLGPLAIEILLDLLVHPSIFSDFSFISTVLIKIICYSCLI